MPDGTIAACAVNWDSVHNGRKPGNPQLIHNSHSGAGRALHVVGHYNFWREQFEDTLRRISLLGSLLFSVALFTLLFGRLIPHGRALPAEPLLFIFWRRYEFAL